MRIGYSDTGEYDEDRNFTYSAKGTYGTSGWMSRKEMAGVLELVSDLHKYQGIVLGMLDRKAVCVPEKTRLNSNLAVYGASGSMKTRSFCMNRILQGVSRGESLVICDPKSELYEKSSEYLRDKGYTVRVFNLVNPENSDSWNCLSEVEGQELMAQLFVDVIIRNTTGGGKGNGGGCPVRSCREYAGGFRQPKPVLRNASFWQGEQDPVPGWGFALLTVRRTL